MTQLITIIIGLLFNIKNIDTSILTSLPEEPVFIEANPDPEEAIVVLTPTAPRSIPAVDRPVKHHPDDVLQEGNKNDIVGWMDYALTYEGLCPHEQPENVFKHDHQWITAIGIQYWDGKTAEGYLQQAWGWWRNGEVSGITHNHTYYDEIFYTDWNTLTVVDRPELTVVLRDFEAKYNSKCPND